MCLSYSICEILNVACQTDRQTHRQTDRQTANLISPIAIGELMMIMMMMMMMMMTTMIFKIKEMIIQILAVAD